MGGKERSCKSYTEKTGYCKVPATILHVSKTSGEFLVFLDRTSNAFGADTFKLKSTMKLLVNTANTVGDTRISYPNNIFIIFNLGLSARIYILTGLLWCLVRFTTTTTT